MWRVVAKRDDGSSSGIDGTIFGKARYRPNRISLKSMNEWAVVNFNFVAAPCCVIKCRVLRDHKNVDIFTVLLISQRRAQGLLLGKQMALVKAE